MMKQNKPIGYCSPPENTKFKKGASGNPKGRPKGVKQSLNNILKKELESKITLNDGSKLSKEECLIKDLVHGAVKGNEKKQKIVLDLKGKFEEKEWFELFVKRLIREKYITENNARAYAQSREHLFLAEKTDVISNIYYMDIVKNTMAFETVKSVEQMADINNRFEATTYISTICKCVIMEYSFWEGVELTLSSARIPKKEQKNIISQLALTREFAAPNENLLKTAVGFYIQVRNAFENHLIFLRDIAKDIRYYDKKEEEYYSKSGRQRVLSNAKANMTNDEFYSLEKHLEVCEQNYKIFMQETKQTLSLEDIAQDEVMNLLSWYFTRK